MILNSHKIYNGSFLVFFCSRKTKLYILREIKFCIQVLKVSKMFKNFFFFSKQKVVPSTFFQLHEILN